MEINAIGCQFREVVGEDNYLGVFNECYEFFVIGLKIINASMILILLSLKGIKNDKITK